MQCLLAPPLPKPLVPLPLSDMIHKDRYTDLYTDTRLSSLINDFHHKINWKYWYFSKLNQNSTTLDNQKYVTILFMYDLCVNHCGFEIVEIVNLIFYDQDN